MTSSQIAKYLSCLNETPKYAQYRHYHWADHLELLCLANLDGEFSDEDLIDRLKERKDLEEGNYDDSIELNEMQRGPGGAGIKPQIDDKVKINVADWFKILEVRSYLYQDSYPFTITDQEIKLKKRLTVNHKVYIYLLLCSNLYLFDKQSAALLSNSFEALCHLAFKNILPSTAVSHLFGSNPINATGRYGSKLSLWDKMNRLAEDLNIKLHPDIDQTQFPRHNRGDGGLDIVGWIPTGDDVSSKIALLAQCACRPEEWKQKQSSASYNTWGNKLAFINYPDNVVFIPFCFRQANGKWFNSADIHKSFLIDRKRLIFYLDGVHREYLRLPAARLVDEIIKAKEGIV